jgi:hypothetical protein
MTKEKLHQMILDLQQQVSEIEEMLRTHITDSTHHSTPQVVRGPERLPVIDPDDGALSGSGTITTSVKYAEWYTDTTPGELDSCPTQPVDADQAKLILGANE